MDYAGGCHCGAIGYVYRTSSPPAEWSVRACQCLFCRAHDAWSTSDPDGSLQLHHRDSAQLQRYRFGLRTADFLVCRTCGVYIGAVIETPRGAFAIINVRTLSADSESGDFSVPVPMTYDTEDTGSRVARRESYWTPVRDPRSQDERDDE